MSLFLALEPSGPLGKMSLPIGMYRRAFSYDDALEDPTPMTPPPSDMGSIPWKPVIPERKYQHLSKVPALPTVSGTSSLSFPPSAPEAAEAPAPIESGCHRSLCVFYASAGVDGPLFLLNSS